MTDIDWSEYNIVAEVSEVHYGAERYSWVCKAFGATAFGPEVYSTQDPAIAACKRWIKKNNIKP